MNLPTHRPFRTLVALVAALALAVPVHAAKPENAGGGKPDKHEKRDKDPGRKSGERPDDGRGKDHGAPDGGGKGGPAQASGDAAAGVAAAIGIAFFGERQREVAREYYRAERSAGRCPPGLAKKDNGCLPPGQAKKWARGLPLPPDVGYRRLPPDLADRFGPPPAGHELVEIAGDILLVTVGAMLVVEALEGLALE